MPKIALIQMPVCADVSANLETAKRMTAEAAQAGAQMVVLPEMFCCLYQNASFIANKEPQGGRIWQALSMMAQENHVYLVGGSMPEDDRQGRIYNTSFCFDPLGGQIGRHRKVHLFDIDVKGGQRFMESDVFTAGDELVVLDTAIGKIGVMICFDIRFVEWARLLTLKGAQIIAVPAAFNMTTGPAHWQMSFKARALDNQVYMVGCAPARDEKGPYVSYGHSIAADPWGAVMQELDEKPGILMADIDLPRVEAVREQLPILSRRRKDIYTLEMKN